MSGGRVSSGRAGRPKSAGGLPMRIAMACSSCARWTVMSVACARVVSSCVWAWATSDFGDAPPWKRLVVSRSAASKAFTVSSRSCFWASAARSSK